MNIKLFLILLVGTATGFNCKVKSKTYSEIVGLWQAKSITIATISLDLISDSLTLPIEYYQEHKGVVPGSSRAFFDSLVLVELKNTYRGSVMANQVEFNNRGQFKFLPNAGDTLEGNFKILSRNKIKLIVSNNSNAKKLTLFFSLNKDLLYMSQTEENELEVVYKRIK